MVLRRKGAMSEHTPGKKNHTAFPVLISLAVLVLAIASGVVNYRQNNLANLESTLRDTREKLDLATKELSDTKLRAVIDFIYGERNRILGHEQQQKSAASDFASERNELLMQLADANDRIKDLEALAEDMSSDLDKKTDALEALKKQLASKSRPKKAEKKPESRVTKSDAAIPGASEPDAVKSGTSEPEPENAETAKSEDSRPAAAEAEAAQPAVSKLEAAMTEINQDATSPPLVGSADVDVYQSGLDMAARKRADEAMRNTGFEPKYPKLPASMSLTNTKK